MSYEKIVCSLELSIAFKELGVPQKSYFKWIFGEHPTEKSTPPTVQHSCALEDSYDKTPVHDGWTLTSYAAFTVSELLEMLPHTIGDDKLVITKDVLIYIVGYIDNNNHCAPQTQDFNPAESLGNMLHLLICKKLITFGATK